MDLFLESLPHLYWSIAVVSFFAILSRHSKNKRPYDIEEQLRKDNTHIKAMNMSLDTENRRLVKALNHQESKVVYLKDKLKETNKDGEV